jgi:hypothetical protein
MVGQYYAGIDVKRSFQLYLANRFPKQLYMVGQEGFSSLQQIHSKKIASTGDSVSSVIGHMQSVTDVADAA